LPIARQCLLRQVEYAAAAGIDFVQIREPDLDARELAALVAAAVGLVSGSRTKLVVNDRLDVALACGAAGVHLRATSIPPVRARAIAPPGFLIGRSVHGVEEAVETATGADYLIAGTVWPTGSKAGSPLLGPAGLAAVAAAAKVPVLAIGGVTLDRIGEVAAAGAAGVAAIGMFLAAEAAAAGPCLAGPLVTVAESARRRFAPSAPPS
jgi:thiamine-phosphate diphosphorylase